MVAHDTDQAIRASFLDLYAERPFERITIKELCERTPLGRTTFYAHYDNLDEVKRAIEDDLLGDLCSIIENGANGNLTSADFTAILVKVIQYVEERDADFRAFLCIQPNARFIARWKDIIKANLSRRYPSAPQNPNGNLMAEILASAMIGAYAFLASNPRTVDREQVAARIDRALSAAMDGALGLG